MSNIWTTYENLSPENWSPENSSLENSETKNRGVCVECSDVIHLWNPKIRQQTFLDSFSVLQFGAYVWSWSKRLLVCVMESIDKNEKVV